MNRLTEKDFTFQCPMRWEDMQPSAHGRFCDRCRKEVFDLSNCTREEVASLQQKHGSICGSIRVVRAAAVAASLSAAACETGQSGRTGGRIAIDHRHQTMQPQPSDQDLGEMNAMEPHPDEVVMPGVIAEIGLSSESSAD